MRARPNHTRVRVSAASYVYEGQHCTHRQHKKPSGAAVQAVCATMRAYSNSSGRLDDNIDPTTPRSKFRCCESTNAYGTTYSNCNGLSATEVRERACAQPDSKNDTVSNYTAFRQRRFANGPVGNQGHWNNIDFMLRQSTKNNAYTMSSVSNHCTRHASPTQGWLLE